MTFVRELLVAGRSLARWPVTGAAVVATLALTIGATATVVSLVDGVLLRPLPLRDSDRVVLVWRSLPSRDLPFAQVSFPEARDWRREATSFSGLAAMENVTTGRLITGGVEPVQVQGQLVSEGFFAVLGAEAHVGRVLTPDDHRPGADDVVVLSHALWQQRYGGDRAAVGRTVLFDGEPFTVVGVMPPHFAYPATAELWTALEPAQPALVEDRDVGWLIAVARLADGVSIETARAEMNTLTARLAETHAPAGLPPSRVEATVTPFVEAYFGPTRRALWMLLGAVGVVLLIAAVNIAALLLARGYAREVELRVRVALGAGLRRAVRPLVLESLLLSVVGGGGGVLVASGLLRVAKALGPSGVPRLELASLDATALSGALAATALVAVVCAVVPAVTVARTLRRGGPLTVARRGAPAGRLRVQGALLVTETALALVLLVGAGLALRSFDTLSRVELGYDPEGVLTVEVPLSRNRYPEVEQRRAFFSQLVEEVSTLPGVERAASVLLRPLWGTIGLDWPYTVEGQTDAEAVENPSVNLEAVSPGYFRTMRIDLLAGREFTRADREGAPGVVIVSGRLADRAWPGEDPLGRRLKIPLQDSPYHLEWLTVVGVVETARYRELEDTRHDLYLPVLQSPYTPRHLVVRAAGDPLALAAPVRRVVSGLDPNQPIDDVVSMTQLVSGALGDHRFRTQVLSSFAVVALLLAALGLYAAMSYLVVLRTAEIGVRRALGASRRSIVRLVVVQAAGLLGMGIALGVSAAVGLTQALEGLLYGVTPTDVVTFGVVSGVLVVTGLVASALPAWRASCVDPLVALRTE